MAGGRFLLEAEGLKETKPKAYEHEYLGIATGTGGQVFENVTVRPITEEEMARFDRIYQGLDFGFGADPAAYEKCIMTGRESVFFYLVKCTEPGWGIPGWLVRLKNIIRLIKW